MGRPSIRPLEFFTSATHLSSSQTPVRVLFASASPDVIAHTLARIPGIDVVVSEFQPPRGEWIPFHIRRSLEENRELALSLLAGREIKSGVIILDPAVSYESLQQLGRLLSGPNLIVVDEAGHRQPLRRAARRVKRLLKSQAESASPLRRLLRGDVKLPALYRMALRQGDKLAASRPIGFPRPLPPPKPAGISVVIPSRDGRDLLERCLPAITGATEIIVVDNGSSDGTAQWLPSNVILEHSAQPLPFSVAMNRGIKRSRYSHICALNNDMLVEPGFLAALRSAFDSVPDLFCASAQIFLPAGHRREETGKTVLDPEPSPTDFPIRCAEPLEGEDHSYVLYGSGGCSLYDGAKLEAMGGFDEVYQPAYVEDLDLGVRAWVRGWPSVYCAAARVLHQHRTTTSRFYTEAELDLALESNYLRFLARAISDPEKFTRMWRHDILRLKARQKSHALALATRLDPTPVLPGDHGFLDLLNGQVAVFRGKPRSAKPVILIASPYLPYPLSHGAAVRIYNLLRQTATDFDLVLVAFLEDARPVPQELRDLCVEIVTVLRPGTHALPSRGRPDTVEEFDTPTFHAALRQTIAKWSPAIVQLEFTQMAVYAAACAPAKTILVEHDITYDLYAQMLARPETNDWESRRQHDLWVRFETEAWKQVDRVVAMSEKDRAIVGENGIAIGNGVDLEGFQPSPDPPAERRLLFIGSFAHKPNVLALEFFLREVFPLLENVTFHVIAGQRHERFWDLKHPGVEVEGFVSDVRHAYRKATLVIAPLVASAGTNIKIVEAMAMGKAIVSTSSGIHGLDLRVGSLPDVVVEDSPQQMAAAITRLLESPTERIALEQQARATAERVYGWPAMARAQKELYRSLL
ncbi:MAG: glycosyltransferase [Acidobacteriota bacterium]